MAVVRRELLLLLPLLRYPGALPGGRQALARVASADSGAVTGESKGRRQLGCAARHRREPGRRRSPRGILDGDRFARAGYLYAFLAGVSAVSRWVRAGR